MPNVRSLRRCLARPQPPRPCATLSDGYARFGRPSVLRPAPDPADKDVRGEAEADRRRAGGEALRDRVEGSMRSQVGDHPDPDRERHEAHDGEWETQATKSWQPPTCPTVRGLWPHVVARIYDPERAEAYEKLGLHTICPTIEGALHIQKVLLERESK